MSQAMDGRSSNRESSGSNPASSIDGNISSVQANSESLHTGQIMETVELREPSLKQLKDSSVADKHGYSYWVTAKDPQTLANIKMVHVPKHVNGPYILMRTDCNIEYQEEVPQRKVALDLAAEKVASAVNGTVEKNATLDGDRRDVTTTVRVPDGITQRQVAELVESNYAGSFEGSKVNKVYYKGVPREEFESLKSTYPQRRVEEYSDGNYPYAVAALA